MSVKSKLSASGIKYHIGVIIWNKILNTELNPDGSVQECLFLKQSMLEYYALFVKLF